ncbi:MAG: hypothetical protein AAF383_00185 [Cyanobacteria bacterium P01_A01_bin.83]
MNRFISTISLISLTSVAGILAATAGVNAQTVDSGEVQMTATVGDVCLFTDPLDGTLGIDPDDLTTLSSSLNANGITTATGDGAAGSIDVTCNNATSTISISSVTQAIPSGITSDSYTATVSGLGSDIVSTDGAAATPVAIGSTATQTLDVDLEAVYGTNVIPGDYTYTVNLVANP